MVSSTSLFYSLVGFITLVSSALALNLSPFDVRKNQHNQIQRVAIIGGGIAGLSLAHCLCNAPDLSKDTKDLEVSLYDSRDSLDRTLGSGVQLNGGVSVLGKINPEVQQAVIDAGTFTSKVKARNKSWFREDSTDSMWSIDIPKIVRDSEEKTREALVKDGTVLWIAIMRGALQVSVVVRFVA